MRETSSRHLHMMPDPVTPIAGSPDLVASANGTHSYEGDGARSGLRASVAAVAGP
jgi:hypothetical protein